MLHLRAFMRLYNTTRRVSITCLTNIVRSLPCHGLARLNIRAKRAHVNFIIHLDKLGHLCTNCSEWLGLLECSCF